MKIIVKNPSPTPTVFVRDLPLGTVYLDSEDDIMLRVDGGALCLSSTHLGWLLPNGVIHRGHALDLLVQETYEIEEIILQPVSR
jgi:hypothetical protein